MIEDRGIDSNRMMIVPVTTVQEFRLQSIKILDKYMSMDAKLERVLDADSAGRPSGYSSDEEYEMALGFHKDIKSENIVISKNIYSEWVLPNNVGFLCRILWI